MHAVAGTAAWPVRRGSYAGPIPPTRADTLRPMHVQVRCEVEAPSEGGAPAAMSIPAPWNDVRMTADSALFDAATALIERRLGAASWKTAAAIRLDDGSILTGIGLVNFSSAAGLCAEVGPLAQAYTADRRVVDSICVNRSEDRGRDLVLAPCGLCQERLALWGPDVEVGVADSRAPAGWSSRRLAELMPYYWAGSFSADDRWPTTEEHAE
jgi:cytidine deaminase